MLYVTSRFLPQQWAQAVSRPSRRNARGRSPRAGGAIRGGGGGGPGPGTTDGGGTVRDGFGTVRDGGGTVRDDGGTVRDGGAPNAKRARLPGSDRGGDSELPKGWGAR